MKCPHCGNDPAKPLESLDEFWRVAQGRGIADDDDECGKALMLYLGYGAGSLSKIEHRVQVAKFARDGVLRIGYLKALRDELNDVIERASRKESARGVGAR
jgi:hypothetical protein